MSTLDGLSTINGAFKQQDGKKIGFYMHLLGSYVDSVYTESGSIFPLNGPLLFNITANKRLESDITISFNYRQADKAGYQNINVRGIQTKQMTYVENEEWHEGSITISPSKQLYYEKLFKSSYDEVITRSTDFYGELLFTKENNTIDNIYEIDDVNVSIEGVDWEVYCMTSNGARLVYGLSFDSLREQGDNIIRSFFTAPRICPLCGGDKVYPRTGEVLGYDHYGHMIPIQTGETCPECNGFGFSGFNAADGTLDLKAFDTGITRSYTDDDKVLQRYIWAEHWWFYPTLDTVKNFISFFTNISPSEITIIQFGAVHRDITYTGDFEYTGEFVDFDDLFYAKESYLDIKIPITQLIASGYDITFIEDILKNKMPVGLNFKISAYNIMNSGGSIGDNEFSILNETYESGETPENANLSGGDFAKTSMLYNGRGNMYNWGETMKAVYNESDWDGTTNTGASDQIGLAYEYGPTPSTYMIKGSAYNVNDSSSVGVGGVLSDTMRTTGQGASFYEDVTGGKELELTTTESTGDTSTTTNVYLTNGSTEDDFYNGGYITVGSETRSITDYNGATKMITCTAFTGAPGDGVEIFINMYNIYKDIINFDNFWSELETTGTVIFVR